MCHPFVSVVGPGPGSSSDWGILTFSSRAVQTHPPQSVTLKLEARDGKKQGVPTGHLERMMDSGGSCAIAISISRVFGDCGPRGQAGPGWVDGALCCVSLGIVLVVQLMQLVVRISSEIL